MRLLERGGHQAAALRDPTCQNRDCQAAERRRSTGRGLTVMYPQSSQSRPKRWPCTQSSARRRSGVRGLFSSTTSKGHTPRRRPVPVLTNEEVQAPGRWKVVPSKVR